MNRFPLHSTIALGTLFLASFATSFANAGQEAVVPLSYLVERSQFIAVVEIQEVTQIDVAAEQPGFTRVYVAQANVEQHIKPVG